MTGFAAGALIFGVLAMLVGTLSYVRIRGQRELRSVIEALRLSHESFMNQLVVLERAVSSLNSETRDREKCASVSGYVHDWDRDVRRVYVDPNVWLLRRECRLPDAEHELAIVGLTGWAEFLEPTGWPNIYEQTTRRRCAERAELAWGVEARL